MLLCPVFTDTVASIGNLSYFLATALFHKYYDSQSL